MKKYLAIALLASSFTSIKCDTMELIGPVISIAAASAPSVLASKLFPKHSDSDDAQLTSLILSASAAWAHESARKRNYREVSRNSYLKPLMFGLTYKLAKSKTLAEFLAQAPMLKDNLGKDNELGVVARSILVYFAMSEVALKAGITEEKNL